jgi:hypothetical protein
MCTQVIRAVRAVLEEEPYASRFTLEVFPWEGAKADEARRLYPFGPDRHGFVVPGPAGKPPLACRPGHFYGETEIREDLDRILGTPTSR